jgi:hypothetical protein
MLVGACAADPLPSDTSAPSPRFQAVFEEVFVAGGCTSGYCHGVSGTLPMTTAETAYAWLVGVRSGWVACAGEVRVIPGRPEESLLWRKLAPEVPACGRKMPLGRDPLPAAKRNLVRRWIEGGALP